MSLLIEYFPLADAAAAIYYQKVTGVSEAKECWNRKE